MHVSSGESDASSSLLKPTGHLKNHPNVHFSHTIETRTLSLDSWARENGVGNIDFLWLDMQGFELPMIEAAIETIGGVKGIYSEVSVSETYENAILYTEFKKSLEDLGFEAVLELIPANTDMGNVLFIRK